MEYASSGPKLSTRGVNPSISQNITVTCLRSPSILSLWDRIFSVRPWGRYRWIFYSFSSKERSLGVGLGVGSEGRVRLWPHSLQKSFSGLFSEPHWGQTNESLAPHLPQNLAPSLLSDWHFWHFIFSLKGLRPIFQEIYLKQGHFIDKTQVELPGGSVPL